MKILVLIEHNAEHNNFYLEELAELLNKNNHSVCILTDTAAFQYGLDFFNDFDLVVGSQSDHRLMYDWDGKIKFTFLSVNHSFSGPNNFNNYQFRIMKKFDKSSDKIKFLVPSYYRDLFGFTNEYDKNIIYTNSYYKLLYHYLHKPMPYTGGTGYTVYFAHWTVSFDDVNRICEKYVGTTDKFLLRLHPLMFQTYIGASTLILDTLKITKEYFDEQYDLLDSKYELDQLPVMHTIDDADTVIFDGSSNTFIEALIRSKHYESPKRFALEKPINVLSKWHTEEDFNITLKYFLESDPNYQLGTLIELSNTSFLNLPDSLVSLENQILQEFNNINLE